MHFEKKISKLESVKILEFFSTIKLRLVESTYGTIQVLRQQRGGWVGSENGNFC
jgi:hypothetical protein